MFPGGREEPALKLLKFFPGALKLINFIPGALSVFLPSVCVTLFLSLLNDVAVARMAQERGATRSLAPNILPVVCLPTMPRSKCLASKCRALATELADLEAQVVVKRARLAKYKRKLSQVVRDETSSSSSSSEEDGGSLPALEDKRSGPEAASGGPQLPVGNALPDSTASSSLLDEGPPQGMGSSPALEDVPAALDLKQLPPKVPWHAVTCSRCRRWLRGEPGGQKHAYDAGCFATHGGHKLPRAYAPVLY